MKLIDVITGTLISAVLSIVILLLGYVALVLWIGGC